MRPTAKRGPQDAAGYETDTRCMGRLHGGLTKIHAVVDARGLPIARKLPPPAKLMTDVALPTCSGTWVTATCCSVSRVEQPSFSAPHGTPEKALASEDMRADHGYQLV